MSLKPKRRRVTTMKRNSADFERFLHRSPVDAVMNPAFEVNYADAFARDLQHNLEIVLRWVRSAKPDRKAMGEALRFFGTKYRGSGTIYRGTGTPHFDGQAASYTKLASVARAFGEDKNATANGYCIVRRECPAMSLDLQRLLESYASCKIQYCGEAEVIIFNTAVPQSQVREYTPA